MYFIRIKMDNYKPLETMVESSAPLYRRIADRTVEIVKEGFKKPCVKAGVGLGAATLAALLLTPNEAYAAQDVAQQTIENYGFFSGLLDGLIAPINLIMSAFTENTWARDGTGIASEPANFWYNLGFYLMLAGETSTAGKVVKKKSK